MNSNRIAIEQHYTDATNIIWQSIFMEDDRSALLVSVHTVSGVMFEYFLS